MPYPGKEGPPQDPMSPPPEQARRQLLCRAFLGITAQITRNMVQFSSRHILTSRQTRGEPFSWIS